MVPCSGICAQAEEKSYVVNDPALYQLNIGIANASDALIMGQLLAIHAYMSPSEADLEACTITEQPVFKHVNPTPAIFQEIYVWSILFGGTTGTKLRGHCLAPDAWHLPVR